MRHRRWTGGGLVALGARAQLMRDSFHGLLLASITEALANAPQDTGECLTVMEAADRMQVSRATVQRLVDRGELRSMRVGRSIRIRLVDLLAFEAEHVVNP